MLTLSGTTLAYITLCAAPKIRAYQPYYRSILNAGKHTPIVLSRSSKSIPDNPNVEVRMVDYSSHSSLVPALQDIHTVIVTLTDPEPTEFVASQLALLKAAKEAGVRRFAPSEWGAMVSLCLRIGCYK